MVYGLADSGISRGVFIFVLLLDLALPGGGKFGWDLIFLSYACAQHSSALWNEPQTAVVA